MTDDLALVLHCRCISILNLGLTRLSRIHLFPEFLKCKGSVNQKPKNTETFLNFPLSILGCGNVISQVRKCGLRSGVRTVKYISLDTLSPS